MLSMKVFATVHFVLAGYLTSRGERKHSGEHPTEPACLLERYTDWPRLAACSPMHGYAVEDAASLPSDAMCQLLVSHPSSGTVVGEIWSEVALNAWQARAMHN